MKNAILVMLAVAVFCLALAVIQLNTEVRRLKGAADPAFSTAAVRPGKVGKAVNCVIEKAKKMTKAASEKLEDIAD